MVWLNNDDLRLVTGKKDQDQITIMTIEEMSELTQVLTKTLRKDNTTKTPKELYSELVEEMADTWLMLMELQLKMDIDSDEVTEIVNFKMDRWLKRNGYREE